MKLTKPHVSGRLHSKDFIRHHKKTIPYILGGEKRIQRGNNYSDHVSGVNYTGQKKITQDIVQKHKIDNHTANATITVPSMAHSFIQTYLLSIFFFPYSLLQTSLFFVLFQMP